MNLYFVPISAPNRPLLSVFSYSILLREGSN